MQNSLLSRFDDCYPEDEHEPPIPWQCTKCHQLFVDNEEYLWADAPNHGYPLEPKLYWLGITEPICEACAIDAGIPAIDRD